MIAASETAILYSRHFNIKKAFNWDECPPYICHPYDIMRSENLRLKIAYQFNFLRVECSVSSGPCNSYKTSQCFVDDGGLEHFRQSSIGKLKTSQKLHFHSKKWKKKITGDRRYIILKLATRAIWGKLVQIAVSNLISNISWKGLWQNSE